MTAIEVHGIAKDYPGIRALDGVDLTVERGEIVGLLGPNGAGKTTLLRILTGGLAPTEGTATVEGHDVVSESLSVRRCVGYLPESAPLYPEMTPRQYLRFMGAVRRTAAKDEARAVDRCGIGAVMDRPVAHLSKGYRQRVGLAQAILHWPTTLLLDEPTSGLDPNQIAEIRDLIREIGQERTVILSSHILSEVEATCDRVVIIDHGRIAAAGATAELTSRSGDGWQLTVEMAGVPADDAIDALSNLPGVATAEPTGSQSILVSANADVRAAVFGEVVRRGWTLLELRSERHSLESVYRSLVQDTPDFDRNSDDVLDDGSMDDDPERAET